MRTSKSPYNRLAVSADETVFVSHYINTGDVRIRFEPRGYVPEGLFRFVLRAVKNPHSIKQDSDTIVNSDGSVKFVRGPVTIVAKASGRNVSMHVKVELPDGDGVTEKSMDCMVVEEVEERLDQLQSMKHTFPPPEKENVPRVRASGTNGHSGPRAIRAASAPRRI